MGGELLGAHAVCNTIVKRYVEVNPLDLRIHCLANGATNIEKMLRTERLVLFNIVLMNHP